MDPSEITPTEILDLKTIVRGDHKSNDARLPQPNNVPNTQLQHNQNVQNGLILPKNSHVARSNSLRSSSPPRLRRDFRNQPNVPPSVPEESHQSSTGPQYPTMRHDQLPYASNQSRESPAEWTNQPHHHHEHPQFHQHHQDNTLQHYSDHISRVSPTAQNQQDVPENIGSHTRVSGPHVPYQNSTNMIHPPVGYNPMHGSSSGLNGNVLNQREFLLFVT